MEKKMSEREAFWLDYGCDDISRMTKSFLNQIDVTNTENNLQCLADKTDFATAKS